MGTIVVVGVGYEVGHLTLEAVELLKNANCVVLHTGRCGCAEWLKENGISYETLDALYETCEDFDEHAQAAAQAVQGRAADGDVVYGVFDVRDRSVSELVKREPSVRVVAGPPMEGALLSRAQGTVQLLEASDWENYALSSARNALIRELDSRELASEVKMKLMEIYPDETEVFILFSEGRVAHTQLYNLDRMRAYDHRTCALVTAEPNLLNLQRYDFDRLLEVITILLGPNGCPWDRAQTHKSLRPYIIEEAYEVVGAIDDDDPYHLYDELGDLLFQIVLQSEIGRLHGEFDITDVITAISEKMISRHSFVFGTDEAADAGEANDLWAKKKMEERGQTTRTETLRDVSKSMPATMRAAKVLKRLNDACHQKQTAEGSLRGLKRAVDGADGANPEQSWGDALLWMIDAMRARKIDPEIALNAAADRLIQRFSELEESVLARGEKFEEKSPEALQKYWNCVKLSD